MKSPLNKPFNDPVLAEAELKTKPESYWVKRGEKAALKLFHKAAKSVPAYKDFLKKNNIDPTKIKTIEDFKKVPSVDKDNYLRQYPLRALCWNGKLNDDQRTIYTTSGSTGEPFYFPHTRLQDWHYATVAELYMRTNFQIHKKRTLYINAFPMGAWIGGVFTYEAVRMVAERGNYKLAVISPGIHKDEVIKAVRRLGPQFDQIIIGAYGPFLKDIVDDGIDQGVRWRDYNLKFVFSAEVVTEKFRDYIARRTGLKNCVIDTLNHYGTVDLGTMSYETPLSIFLRRKVIQRKRLQEEVFGENTKVPTVTQYIPELFYFEEIDGVLHCTAEGGIPLVRYNLKDVGNVISSEDMVQRFKKHGYNLLKCAKEAGLGKTLWNLPFVQVFERTDFSVSFFAFQVYPETIRRALQHRELASKVTGKFMLDVEYDEEQNQHLVIHLETRNKTAHTKAFVSKVSKYVRDRLVKESSEYRETYKEKGSRIDPVIKLYSYQDSRYFIPGKKQVWVKKH